MEIELYDYWNKIGSEYVDTWRIGGRKYISLQEEKFIKDSIKNFNGSKITALDLGCGTGRMLSILEKDSKIDSLYGLDFNKAILDYCRRRFKSSKKIKNFIQADISEKLPFKNGSFELVISIRVLKYNQNWSKILRECHRILNKNGILVFEMPNKFSVNRLSRDDITIFSSSENELKSVLKKIGLKILEIKGGPVLPGVFYDRITNKILAKIMQKTETFIKLLFGKVLFSRFIYISCTKV